MAAERSQVHPAAAASSAAAAPSTALFRELPSSSNDPTPRAEPLCIDSLPQEWFVDPVPGALICCICTEVARDPPNLEACGQSHSHASHCCSSPVHSSNSVSRSLFLSAWRSLQATPFAATV
jgi:hypothetical protein